MSNTGKEAAAVTVTASFSQRMARWIDDPFASMLVGIVIPAAASTVVLSGIWALGVVG